jgi:putative Mg2+ transporter-C (MgtC) family protein
MLADIVVQLQTLAKVSLASVLGGLIGLEREIAAKPAGFRTHMLVAGAAALIIGLADPLLALFTNKEMENIIQPDPFRLFEAIITGVAFLGAGTIIRRYQNGSIEGLTTAGSILVSAVIGICIALNQFVLGLGMTLLALVLLRVMRVLDNRINRKNG